MNNIIKVLFEFVQIYNNSECHYKSFIRVCANLE